MSKAHRFLQITFSFFFTVFPTIKTLSPRYLDNALTDSVLTSRTTTRLLEEKAPVIDFGRTVPTEKYCCKHSR